MAPPPETGVLARVSLSIIEDRDAPRVREAHALLLEGLGVGNVEDFESFQGTVSPATDRAVVPIMLCATYNGRIQGLVLGAYLRNLDMGMLLYSAVRKSFRGQGVYTRLRAGLMDLLASEATSSRINDAGPPGKLDYVLSELDAQSRLGRKYVREWGAFVSPCDYEIPAAQALTPRRMDLLMQPTSRRSPPTAEEIVAIVREIYQRVYRLESVDSSAHFRRVVQSVRTPSPPGPTVAATDGAR
jgi:hypothetical protein